LSGRASAQNHTKPTNPLVGGKGQVMDLDFGGDQSDPFRILDYPGFFTIRDVNLRYIRQVTAPFSVTMILNY